MHARKRPTAPLIVLAGLGLGEVGLIGPAAYGQNAAAAAAQVEGRPGAGEGFKDADSLLNALETTGQDMTSLTADIRYTKVSELQGDRQLRTGKLFYVSGKPAAPAGQSAEAGQPAAARKFAIQFDQEWLDGVRRDYQETYIFDGEWLVEKYPKENPPLFLKRQVVPPGEKFDPLRIGEGPFPIPIGQRKADILNRYTVELLPAGAGLEAGADALPEQKSEMQQLTDAARGASQLRLVPRPERAEEEAFSEIRLWYVQSKDGILLPRMARTVSKNGDNSTVVLLNPAAQLAGRPTNPEAVVPPAILDTTAPREGWEVRIEPWRKAADAGVHREGPEVGEPDRGPR